MIPIRLRLRNFMCYRGEPPPLDFRGIHLACLAGQNGHGKSALLDAITWALWGKARSSRDNNLITLGEEEMEVEFDFALGGAEYRVNRKRSSKGSGRTALEFQVKSGERYLPLTESTIGQTQRKIDAILRMDYDTFINSAFLLQGRANEFTTKAPAERKRVLGDILGLSIYDAYEQLAKDKARQAEQEEQSVSERIAEIDRELANEPQYEAERRQAEAAVAALGQELREAEERADRLRQEKRVLDMQRKQYEELTGRIARAESALKEVREQLWARRERLQHLEEILSKREEIENGYAALQEARVAESAMSAKLSRLMALNQEKGKWEQAIYAARVRLESDQRVAQERLAELQRRIAEAEPLKATLAEVSSELERLAEQERAQEEARQQLEALSAERASLIALNQRLREEMDALQEKIALLEEAEARCPLCGSELSPERRVEVIEGLRAEGKAKGDTYRSHQARLAEIKKEAKALEETCRHSEKALQARPRLQREEAKLERALEEAAQAQAEAERLTETSKAIGRQLAENDFAPEARAELARLEEEIAVLGYDGAAHEAARERLAVYQHFEAEYQELSAAARLLEETKEAIAELSRTEARWQAGLQEDRAQLAELDSALAAAGDLERRLQEALSYLGELRQRESEARLRLGAAQQKLANCITLREERERQSKKLKQLAEDKSAYRELQLAFGQKGLRAMIIESAIPEIEEEANALLARMTENRMHVRFETQRETLKGDTVETLDIQIADELGTRNYEMYSGGEAFRVDFAIRVALSKLLARRAGAQLQTLVIDEGFGTQDAQGRERLVEAISSIRDDFACILVITHIEELQEAFPVRINVFKTAEGSRFSIT